MYDEQLWKYLRGDEDHIMVQVRKKNPSANIKEFLLEIQTLQLRLFLSTLSSQSRLGPLQPCGISDNL